MKTHIQWNQLIELLDAEIRLYRRLIDLIETEAQALAQSDLTLFNQILKEKQDIVERMQRSEADRSKWIAHLDIPEGSIRLKALIARAPGETATRLDHCRRELVSLAHALEARNLIHKKMLNHSRDWASNALTLLGGQLYVQPTYAANGNLTGAGKGGAVLSGLA